MDGTLRTFELATGASLGRASVHADRVVQGFAIADVNAAHEVFTWDAEGRVARLSLPELEEQMHVDLGAGTSVQAVVAQHGNALVVRAPEDGSHIVELRHVEDGASVVTLTLDAPPRFALSDDGTRIAIVAGPRALVLSAETGATLHDHHLAPPPLGDYAGAVAFHGEGTLVLGFGSDKVIGEGPGVGVAVVELASGAVVAHHRARGQRVDISGGSVRAIESMPEHECFAYSVSWIGLVYLVDDAEFLEIAEREVSSGGRADVELSHIPGSARLHCSGMEPNLARVFDTRALRVRAQAQVSGLRDLQESPHHGFVIGLRSGRVVVLDADDLAPRYERQELTGPGTRLLRGDSITTTRDADPSAWHDVHITRGGESQPLASFAAWLDDPFGLAGVTLAHLPAPPRIERGPERHVATTRETHALTFDALDPAGALLGAWVLAAGRAPRFLDAPDAAQNASFSAEIAGPWPLDVELVAVSRTGVESKPWRIQVVTE